MENNIYKNRSDLVYETLKQEILDLRLKPGQLISEAEICSRFCVSRTPVRDALRMLQEQGFVINIPYKGIFITLLNLNNIKQLIYMRFAVESMVLRDFMQIKTPLLLEEIHHLIRVQEAMVQEKTFTPEHFYRIDAQMHSVWFTATGKQKLWEILQGQQLHYTRYRMLDFVTETDFARIIRDHKHLYQLIEKGDSDSLEASLKEHLYYSITRMRPHIEDEYKDYFENDTI